MELVEGTLTVGGDRFADVGAVVETLEAIGTEYGVTVQAFDARYVVSRRHLERAVELADRERARGEAIARDRSVEILLYAAGRRQIDRAMEMGIGDDETPTVVVVDSSDENDDSSGDTTIESESAAAAAVADHLTLTETLGAYDEALVREFFEITDAELEATSAGLEALVCERVALLVIDR
jgi:KEOPS complex subunit Cgi121